MLKKQTKKNPETQEDSLMAFHLSFPQPSARQPQKNGSLCS